jgi:hypothetical protein
MENVNHLVHAYRIAPWRIQRQWVGNVLLVVVGVSMIAALYLDVTARAAISGREIQDLKAAIQASQQTSSDLETQLANQTSMRVMRRRAFDLGYRLVKPNEIDYVTVPGYRKPQPEILAVVPLPSLRAPNIPPEYTESLLDWFDQKLIGGGLQ